MKKKVIPFNVIIDDCNAQEFKAYDVMPYLMNCYKTTKKDKRPKTFDECKEFVISNSRYMYWARCQYEICLKAWCSRTKEKKVDVHWQIKMNLGVITRLFMENLGIQEK